MYNNPNCHIFSVEEIKDKKKRKILDRRSGLYFAKDFNNKIIYIGVSNNLFNRLDINIHNKLSSIQDEIKEIIAIEIKEKREIRKRIDKYGYEREYIYEKLKTFERDLIIKFEPKFNISNTKITRITYVVKKYGEIIAEFNGLREIEESFNSNTVKGKTNVINNKFNGCNLTDLPKLKRGEEIKGIEITKIKGGQA